MALGGGWLTIAIRVNPLLRGCWGGSKNPQSQPSQIFRFQEVTPEKEISAKIIPEKTLQKSSNIAVFVGKLASCRTTALGDLRSGEGHHKPFED